MRKLVLIAGVMGALAVGCGDEPGDGSGGGGGGGGGDSIDAGAGGGGGDGITECNDGIDNDGDGLIDGFDPECTGSIDNNEGSFATGIPGDNIDAKKQDCFFDGNSGGGDDKCAFHTCCLLDVCPPELEQGYDPTECAIVQDCIDFCAPLTPPGCDCFGCCTVCNENGDCRSVLINEAVAPECDSDTLLDEDKCPACTPNEDCAGSDCTAGVEDCQVCPGEPLPPGCDGYVCDNGTACTTTDDCPTDQFCSNGCCIFIVQ